MADKDYSQLSTLGSSNDSDLIAVYPSGGPLKKLAWSTFVDRVATAIAGTYLTVANNLSDLASASAARSNLGLGSAAQLASSALFQVANNLSEVANAATARANLGAAASASPSFTGGVTQSGSTKQSVQAVSGTDFDLSLQDFFTKSISGNTTFTFSNATGAVAQGFAVRLTISSGAVDTWPASVKWAGGTKSTLGNGSHVLGFLTFDGGTTWIGMLGAKAYA